MSQKEIIYFHDPVCGWCYGFTPVFKQAMQEFAGDFKFTFNHAGMWSCDRTKRIEEVKDFIVATYPKIKSLTDAQFGEEYVNNFLTKTGKYSSKAAIKAIIAFRELDPANEVVFIEELQKAHFIEGLDLEDMHTYRKLAKQFGLNEEIIVNMMESDAVHDITHDEIQWTQNLGLEMYPSLVLKDGDDYSLITSGYENIEKLRDNLKRFI